MGRTYKDVLKAAAALLHKEDSSISFKGYKKNLSDAHLAVCNWTDEPWRHLIAVPLELEALGIFLAAARDCHTPLKICSGLPLTHNKVNFFTKHKGTLGFETGTFDDLFYWTVEKGDYLYAPTQKGGKPVRIFQDLKKLSRSSTDSSGVVSSSASAESHPGIDTVILIDNAPTACHSVVDALAPKYLLECGLYPLPMKMPY